MNKKKIIIVILITAVWAYIGFWFFKAYQYKKQINNFVAEINKDSIAAKDPASSDNQSEKNQGAIEGGNFSISDISASGFPLSHKVAIKDFGFGDNKGRISIKEIVIESGVFSSDFVIKKLDPIVTEDANKNILSKIEFNADAKITGKIIDDQFSQIEYTGSGYKVLDGKNNPQFIFESKNFKTLFLDGPTTQLKITGEGSRVLDGENNVIFIAESSLVDIKTTTDNGKYSSKLDLQVKNFEYPKAVSDGQNKVKNNLLISATVNASAHPDAGKMIDMLPAGQMAKIPSQYRSQYQRKPSPYIWNIDLQNLDFSNPLYKILINGKLATFVDDEIPSGVINLGIDNFDNLIINIVEGIKTAAQERKTKGRPGNDKVDMASQMATQFADKISTEFKYLATKNSASQGNLLMFEIKRDKKAQPLINNVGINEIFMRLMQPDQPEVSQQQIDQMPVDQVRQ